MSDSAHYNRLSFWCNNHLRAFIYALGELYRSPFQSITTLLVIAIAMALPIGFYTLLGSTLQLSEHWHNEPGITLYLKKSSNSEQTKQLIQQLNANSNIKQVRFISPEQGLKQFSEVANMQHVLDSVQDNPLPGVVLITPIHSQQTPEHMNALLSTISQSDTIDNAQIDQQWIKRFYYLVTMAKRLCLALAVLFGLGVILITGNTIRLSLQSHCDEISLLQMIGATPRYIMRPMLYRGLLYGFIGGLIALLLISGVFHWLSKPLAHFVATYSEAFSLHLLSAGLSLIILTVCALLGLIGAWIASKQYLRHA